MADDAWKDLAGPFVDGHYGSLRGRVRTCLVDRQLRAHLPPPPADLVDVGGGAGHQAIPLLRAGYPVTVVDPSSEMLGRAEKLLAEQSSAVRRRATLVQADGVSAPARLGAHRFAGVLCHGVIMYVDDPEQFMASVVELVEPGGIVSVVAKNQASLAVRPALCRDWATALAAFDATSQVNGLGVDTRADTVEGVTSLLGRLGVDTAAWYGVRLFTDGWTRDRPSSEMTDDLLAVEWEASRRDPYRRLSRLFHLIGARRSH